MDILVLFVPAWLGLVGVVALIARGSCRKPATWLLYGLLLGPLALAHILFAPRLRRRIQPLAWPPEKLANPRVRGAVARPFTAELLYRDPSGSETYHSVTVLGHDTVCEATGRHSIERIYTFCATGKTDMSFATAGILEMEVHATGEVLHPPAVQAWLVAKLLTRP